MPKIDNTSQRQLGIFTVILCLMAGLSFFAIAPVSANPVCYYSGLVTEAGDCALNSCYYWDEGQYCNSDGTWTPHDCDCTRKGMSV